MINKEMIKFVFFYKKFTHLIIFEVSTIPIKMTKNKIKLIEITIPFTGPFDPNEIWFVSFEIGFVQNEKYIVWNEA